MQTILIVEDDADIREILSFNIENAGYAVLGAVSAEAAETLVEDASLILLDVMLPGMSGYQFAKKLRSEGNDIPVIFLTARSAENDLLTGFSAGADDYTPSRSPSTRCLRESRQCSAGRSNPTSLLPAASL